MDVLDNQVSNPNAGLVINHTAKQHLMETAKWANFLAIVSFVFLALFVVLALFAGSIMSFAGGAAASIYGAAPGIMVTVLYLLFALLYFFPILYIYKFAKHAKSALRTDDTHELQIALQNQKSAYKFMGILTIIGLVLYALLIVTAIISGGLAMLG